MSDPVIRVESLSKYYRLGSSTAPGASLRDIIAGKWGGMLKREPQRSPAASGFWALKDVSFEIARGQVVGVVGRNGAGKSTLLKILSRIVSPSEGRIRIVGRVGSLLEVGTGFHPELSGRENVYLNGAILGMHRAEIDRKFDEIVAFAEVEQFIDTPVKRYSSGMYVRLAFAVAAHLEPEILIVDEVLAVGDASFQRKCLGKMGEVAHDGRTILFVSHNMSAVAALCNHALMFEHGRLIAAGDVADISARYQTQLFGGTSDSADLDHARHFGSGKARCTSMRVAPLDANGEPQAVLYSGQDLLVELTVRGIADARDISAQVSINDAFGYRIIDVSTGLQGSYVSVKEGEEATVRFHLRNVLLRPGMYLVGLWLGRQGIEDIDQVEGAAQLIVEAMPEGVRSPDIHPGVYQCKFTQSIDYHGALSVDESHLEESEAMLLSK